jgi:hypothetical protein
MSASDQIAALRQQLAARFPTAQRALGRTLATGIATIDESTGGGLPLSAVTEITCRTASCGGQLLFQQLLAVTRQERRRIALVDSADNFDPASCPSDLLTHLLWVRGTGTALALQATDLLARDANLGLVVLDLRRAPESDLRRIPAPQWYRLQRAIEPTDSALVVFTPRASVASAQLRLELSSSFGPEVFQHERPALIARLSPVVQRQRVHAAAVG